MTSPQAPSSAASPSSTEPDLLSTPKADPARRRLAPEQTHPASLTAATTAPGKPSRVVVQDDDFPARFRAVNLERQRARRSISKRGVTGLVQHGWWKLQYTIGTHTSLSMLETWEVLLILTLVSLLAGAITFYIVYRLPAHSKLAAERAAYYLFGTRSSSTLLS
ncbi:hypothetical protein V8E36_006944 [Tilletia maclaganii]